MRAFSLACLLALLSGCWVAPSPDARHVAVLNGVDVGNCRLLSRTDLSVPDKLGNLQRMPDDMQMDLQTLAKNQAATAGGDAVAPLTVQDGGKQSWGIYNCGSGTGVPTGSVSNTTSPPAVTAVKTLPYTPPVRRPCL